MATIRLTDEQKQMIRDAYPIGSRPSLHRVVFDIVAEHDGTTDRIDLALSIGSIVGGLHLYGIDAFFVFIERIECK